MPVYIFNALDDPSALTGATQAGGINDTGQIVGGYHSPTGTHGFLLSGGTYTTLDDPSATMATGAGKINNLGQIVGTYSDASGDHGFFLSGGVYTTLDNPSANFGTVANSMNDADQIVGFYLNITGTHGFLLSGGTYTRLDDPLAAPNNSTFANGITTRARWSGFTPTPAAPMASSTAATITPPSTIPWVPVPLHSASTIWARS